MHKNIISIKMLVRFATSYGSALIGLSQSLLSPLHDDLLIIGQIFTKQTPELKEKIYMNNLCLQLLLHIIICGEGDRILHLLLGSVINDSLSLYTSNRLFE